MTVLLEDGTVGETTPCKVGQFMTVTLHDENGNFMLAFGVVKEILEDD